MNASFSLSINMNDLCFLFVYLQPCKDGEMPAFTAMEQVLPEYQYIFQPGDDAPTGKPDVQGGQGPSTSKKPG